MKNQRKVYGEEFRGETVGLSLRPDQTIKETAEYLGVNANVLTHWRRTCFSRTGEKALNL